MAALSDRQLREKDLEAFARRRIREAGGLMKKWVSPGTAGVPDDIVFWPGGVVHFLEFKTMEGRVSDAQVRLAWALNALGTPVRVMRTRSQVELYVRVNAVRAKTVSGARRPVPQSHAAG